MMRTERTTARRKLRRMNGVSGMSRLVLLILCAALILGGCGSPAGNGPENTPGPGSDPSGFPGEQSASPDLAQTSEPPDSASTPAPVLPWSGQGDGTPGGFYVRPSFRLKSVCKAEGGYYLQNEGFVYYMDAASGRMVLLCGRPECDHSDYTTCNAWANTQFLSFQEGKLWYTNGDAMHQNYVALCTMERDGSEHRDVQNLKEQESSMTGGYQPMLWSGEIWFVENESRVFKSRVGGDIRDNALLVDLDTSDKLEWEWRFTNDGTSAYVMCNYMGDDGRYRDALWILGDGTEDSREIWNSSDVVRSAEKSDWILLDGKLYYCASGELWLADLSTGESRQLGTVRSGQLLMTDVCIYVLAEADRILAVYGLDGTLQKEISLEALWTARSDIYNCDIVFSDGGMVWLLAYRGRWLSVVSSLFQIDAVSGEIRELETWPAAGVEQPPMDDQEYVIGINGGGSAI